MKTATGISCVFSCTQPAPRQSALCSPHPQDMSEGSGCGHALFKARYAFQQTNEDELSFSKGDIISVSRQEEGGWWEGSVSGNSGWFPSNYVRELKGSGGCSSYCFRCCASFFRANLTGSSLLSWLQLMVWLHLLHISLMLTADDSEYNSLLIKFFAVLPPRLQDKSY